jgi:predicted alpha/beta-fold hydrolase
MSERFHPPAALRNPHVQTILASSRLRALGSRPLVQARRPHEHRRRQRRPPGRFSQPAFFPTFQPGASSPFSTGGKEAPSSPTSCLWGDICFLRGYDIFRLNLRDHGDTHNLNQGLFHGALIEETFTAVREVSRLAGDKPFYLVGFSLGGNFALRIALRQQKDVIPNLRQVIAVSPALDPYKSTLCIDGRLALYRRYFLKKWKTSLRKKQALYPKLYDFRSILKHATCLGLTEAIMPWFPDFPDYRTYFNHYTLLGGVFQGLTVPVAVITAADDPVVPVEDFYDLAADPHLTLYIHPYGGHCGFIESLPFSSWYERKAIELFEGRGKGSSS